MSLLPSRGPDVSTAQEGEMQVVGVDEDVEPLLDALASDTARAVLNAIYEEPGTPSEIADRLEMSIQKVSYHLDKLEDQDLIAVAGTRYSEKGQEMKVYEPPDEPLVLFVGTQERKQSLRTLVKRLLPTVGILALASVAIQRFFARTGGDGGGFTGLGADDAADGDYAVAEDEAAQDDSGSGGDAGPDGDDGGGDVDIAEDAGDVATETPRATEEPAAEPTEPGADGGNVSVEMTGAEETSTPTEVATEAIDAGARATEVAAEGAGLQLSPGVAFFLGGVLVLAVLVGFWAYRTYA